MWILYSIELHFSSTIAIRIHNFIDAEETEFFVCGQRNRFYFNASVAYLPYLQLLLSTLHAKCTDSRGIEAKLQPRGNVNSHTA